MHLIPYPPLSHSLSHSLIRVCLLGHRFRAHLLRRFMYILDILTRMQSESTHSMDGFNVNLIGCKKCGTSCRSTNSVRVAVMRHTCVCVWMCTCVCGSVCRGAWMSIYECCHLYLPFIHTYTCTQPTQRQPDSDVFTGICVT